MKAKLPLIARVLLGLVFFGAGLAGLFELGEPPKNLPENLEIFTDGLEATGYFIPLLKVTETVCGILLISGFFVPLALVILAPVVLNIFFVHLFIAPQGLILATVLGLLMIYLAFFAQPYASVIKQLFRKK